MQEEKEKAEEVQEVVRQDVDGVAETARTNGGQIVGLAARVTKLRDELMALVDTEGQARDDAVATMRAHAEAGVRQERSERGKLAEALQARMLRLLRLARVACSR
jgi:hypothetical protein